MCSVVIPTIGRADVLDRCLRALAAAGEIPYEAVVVDNTSGDPACNMVAQRHGARYLTAEWTGLSGARNAGMHASAAPFVAFLDDDAAPEPGWLSALLIPFGDPRVMAVTGRIIPFESVAAARGRAGIVDERALGSEPRVVDTTTPGWFEICNFGGLGTGGNMVFRRDSLEIWPGFRETLGRGTPLQGGEEHHAFFELVRQGYKVAYAPAAVARHQDPHTLKSLRRNHFRDLAGTAGYATLLLVEEPHDRRRILRYASEAVVGKRRAWRTSDGSYRVEVLPRWARVGAYLCGPALYLLSLMCLGIRRLGAKTSRSLKAPRSAGHVSDQAREP